MCTSLGEAIDRQIGLDMTLRLPLSESRSAVSRTSAVADISTTSSRPAWAVWMTSEFGTCGARTILRGTPFLPDWIFVPRSRHFSINAESMRSASTFPGWLASSIALPKPMLISAVPATFAPRSASASRAAGSSVVWQMTT